MVKLTHENLNLCTKNLNTDCIALNKQQLELLNIEWPPKHGWVKELIGKEIDESSYGKLLTLRGKGKAQINQIEKKMKKLEKEVSIIGGEIIWNID